MSKLNNGVFWFEPLDTKQLYSTATRWNMAWFYVVGIDDNTPVALVTGPDDYTACARARIITQALNDERRRAVAASQEDE